MEKTRLSWLDLCKFFGIAYMVWGHAGVSNNLDIYLHSFHMPIFFFISGYLFHPDRYSFPKFLISRTKSLLVPYAVFGFGLCLIWNIFYWITDPASAVPLQEVLYSMATFNPDLSPFAAVQWFLTCLFLVEIAFYLFFRLVRGNPVLVALFLLACSIVGHFYLEWIPFRLVWGADCALVGIVFYGLGYGLQKVYSTRWIQWLFSAPLWLLPVCFGAGLTLALWNGYVNLRSMLFGNYFLFYAAALFSILFYFLLSIRLSRMPRFSMCWFYRGLVYLGQNTLLILALNQSIKRLLTLVFSLDTLRAGLAYYPALYVDIGLAAAILLLCIPCALVVNRWLPWTVGKRRKGSA